MIVSSCFLLILVSFTDAQSCSSYYTCQVELYDKLLNESRPSIRPIEADSQKVPVFLGFSLIKFVAVNEEDSLLTIRAHINETWNATVHSWNSTSYQAVKYIRVPAHSIWTPKIELINPSKITDYEKNHFVHVRSDGVFELSYSSLLTIPCNFDLQDFPFDQQTCSFNLGSTLYDNDEVSITRANDVIIDDGNLTPNGFYFVSHTIELKKIFFAGYDQTYDQISIQLNIHRHPKYFLRLINWPGILLILLTLTVFLLPPSSNERIIYSALLLMGHLILLAIFAFHLPKRLGSTWPWMGRTIFYDIFFTSVLLVFSVFVRMLADRKHYSTQRPPTKIRSFVFGYLAKVVGLKRLSYATLIANRDNEYNANDAATNDAAMEPLTSVSNGSNESTDPLAVSSNSITRDVSSIKQKFTNLIHERTVQQEWLLLADITNRLCFLIYLFLFSFAIGRHLFYK